MITKHGNYKLVTLPELDILAQVELKPMTGWVTIGYVGGSGIGIPPRDWANFVRLVNRIDAKVWGT